MEKIINKILISVLGLIAIFAAGYFIGKTNAPVINPEEIKRQALTEIDRRFNERAKKIKEENKMLVIATEMETKEEDSFLDGTVESVNYKDGIIDVKVYNYVFQGGSLTSFLLGPDYFLKKVIVNQNTEITTVKFPEIPESGSQETIPTEPERIKLGIEEIEIGASVSIETIELFGLKDNKAITARSIFINL